jgi:hypothetical protein
MRYSGHSKAAQEKPVEKDENELAHALVERLAEASPAAANPTLDFEAQYRAHMAKLGKKGGEISGERRKDMPLEVRRRVASIAARARSAKRKASKKR